MLRKGIRFWFILAAIFFVFSLLAGRFVGRILFLVAIIYLIIFIIGRIGSRAENTERRQEKAPETKAPEVNTANVVYEEPAKEEEIFLTPLEADFKEIETCATGIRNDQIRGLAFHVLFVAKDIYREHTEENNSCSNYAQFEGYYIPTLKSVVKNYSVMESRGLATANIQKDMLTYLESCDTALTKLYNSMFEDDLFDMEVKMEAMNIILHKDGLL